MNTDFMYSKTLFIPFSLMLCLGLLLAVVGCSSDQADQTQATAAISIPAPEEVQVQDVSKGVELLIQDEPRLSSFRQLMAQIHSLETLKEVYDVKIFAPMNEAFTGKYERLLTEGDLKARNAFFKECVVLQQKNQQWDGSGETYAGSSVQYDSAKQEVTMNGKTARVIHVFQLPGGHEVYMINKMLAS